MLNGVCQRQWCSIMVEPVKSVDSLAMSVFNREQIIYDIIHAVQTVFKPKRL